VQPAPKGKEENVGIRESRGLTKGERDEGHQMTQTLRKDQKLKAPKIQLVPGPAAE
jgi:hypothetical protein